MSVGFLVRGRSDEEEDVREGEGRGLMLLLLFQSGRSRGCCFCVNYLQWQKDSK